MSHRVGNAFYFHIHWVWISYWGWNVGAFIQVFFLFCNPSSNLLFNTGKMQRLKKHYWCLEEKDTLIKFSHWQKKVFGRGHVWVVLQRGSRSLLDYLLFFFIVEEISSKKAKALYVCTCSMYICKGISFVPSSPMFLRPVGCKIRGQKGVSGRCPLGLLNDEWCPPIRDADGP